MRAPHGWLPVLRVLTRPLPAAAILFLAYVLLSLPLSGEAYLGTDTGAKVATLDRMIAEDSWRPDVGYWAEEWDPAGDYHPLFDTRRTEDGDWVNVTTLPMLLLARPLYDVGGYHLALVLPMLGAVAAALASRNIARQLGDDGAGWRAFWVAGLASPVVVYALDLWEHALGLGLMLWALAHLLRIVRAAGAWPLRFLVAGVLLGAAATMRSESLVVAFVAVGATCALLAWRRRITAAVGGGALAVVGFAGPWFANLALEASLQGNSRASRVTDTAQRDVWDEAGERLEEAAITWFGLPGVGYPRNIVLGVVVVGGLIASVWLHRRGERRASTLVLLLPGAIYLLFLLSGPAFVSGALIASPLAVGALWRRRPDSTWFWCLAFAAVATVLTWAFQFTGGAGPQWGGRYLLVPTLLLTTLGAVAWHEAPVATRRLALGAAVLVSAFGVAWSVERSQRLPEVFEALEELPADVVVSTNGFFVREAGPAYDDRRYLSLGRGADLDGAVDVVEDAGLDTFAVLTRTTERPELDAKPTGAEVLTVFGVDLHVYEYALR